MDLFSKKENKKDEAKNQTAKKKINLNMEIGTPKKLKNDIDFFEALRQESRSQMSDMKPIIISAVSFLLVIIVAFTGIKVASAILTTKTNDINTELASEEMKKTLSRVETNATKNGLLCAYMGVLNSSTEKFKKLEKLDSKFFKSIAKSTPSSVTVTSINISTQQISIFCESKTFTDPSVYMQALVKTNYFVDITFTSVVWDEEKSIYTFTMTCTY